MAADATGRRHMRASHADREQVIVVLKDAFAQGRLDKDELDARLGQAFASRTYAELAVVTADIPADPAPRQPARAQNEAQRHPVRNGAVGVGISLIVAAAAVLGAFILDDHTSLMLFGLGGFMVFAVVPLIILAIAVGALDDQSSRRQLPPRPGQGGQAPEVQRPSQVGHDADLPRDRPDQAHADLRTDRSRSGRPRPFGWGMPVPRGTRSVQGAVSQIALASDPTGFSA